MTQALNHLSRATRFAYRALCAFALVGSTVCAAQTWPTKAIKLVIPFPAGGSTDIVGRLLAEKLTTSLGQTVIVENRAGAGGTTGSDVVAKAVSDGYTLLIGTSSTHAIAPALYERLSYNSIKDFSPVALVGTATILLVTHPSLPVSSVTELIALAKSKPGELSFGSTGNGSVSHLTAEYFKATAGIAIEHIPYKGDTPMTIDLVSGRISLAFGTAVAFLPYVQNGKLKALAVTSAKASPIAPTLPTVSASGLNGFEALQWFGVFAPAGVSSAIVKQLNTDVNRVLQLADVRQKFESLGIEISNTTQEQFAQFIRDENTKWAKIVKASGAKVD
jgi:tripartite-type tricarboxylate transporter receptor subunit TctC